VQKNFIGIYGEDKTDWEDLKILGGVYMRKKIIWMLVSCLMVLSLVIASCGKKEGGGQQTSDVPQYGGSVTLVLTLDVNDWLPWSLAPPAPVQQCNEWLWNGDWAKGPAGGYGTNQVGWEASTNLPGLKAYYIAEDINWQADPGGETGTVFIKVKSGIHYGLDTSNPASQLVNGREVTADDVLWNFDARMNDPRAHPGAYIYAFFPWMHGIHGTKIAPDEISYTFPISQLLNGIMFLCDGSQIFPPELDEAYPESTTDWHCCVGAGPFMIEDYVVSNSATVKRNPNFFDTNPVGPGKGDQLPYLDEIKYLIMPDASTRQAAFRTAQLDQMTGFSIEDRALFVKQNPDLEEAVGGLLSASLLGMRTDLPGTPYADVRVRKAMMMATDFNTINDSLYQGLGQILTWPYWYQKGYEDLYLSLDDPDCPDEVKELYVYNPDKAIELLTEAGYPNGFKGEVLMNAPSDVDYYSIIKDQWDKVGIDIEFNVQEWGAYWGTLNSVGYDEMVVAAIPPPSSWPEVAGYTGVTSSNFSRINDAHVNEATNHMLTTAITDLPAAMKETRELMKYLLPGAWVIPTPRYPTYTLWFPWLKNYSGENSVGWLAFSWPRWIWVDQGVKSSMGY
jgi:peptide/nickel transport system substrate-binding protein